MSKKDTGRPRKPADEHFVRLVCCAPPSLAEKVLEQVAAAKAEGIGETVSHWLAEAARQRVNRENDLGNAAHAVHVGR